MKLGKILTIAAIGIGIAAAAGAYGSKTGEVVAEGTYENKGQVAQWQIRSKDGSNTAYVKFPGSDWTEIGSNYGAYEPLGQIIDTRMKENGYLPSGVGMTQEQVG